MAYLYSAMRAQLTLPVLLFLVLFFGVEDVSYEVSGVLVNESGMAVSGHRVMLYDGQSLLIAEDETDGEGRFLITYQSLPTSADPQGGPDLPAEFTLGASYPNPFNPRTTIPFYAPANTHAVITVYNILGQQVLRSQADISAGSHEILVNLGGRLSQGQYILRVQGEGFSVSQGMTFVSAGIGGGNPEITVRPGGQGISRISDGTHLDGQANDRLSGNTRPVGQTGNRISGSSHRGNPTGSGSSGSMSLADDEVVFRIVFEETERYQRKERTVAAFQSTDIGSVILATRQDPLDKLPGDEEETVASATYNLSVPSNATEENISIIEEEGEEQRIIRTEIGISIHPDGNIRQVNQLLQKYDAQIVDMVSNRRFLVIQIPDPGNMDSFNELVGQIGEEDIVQFVLPSVIVDNAEPARQESLEKVPAHIATESRIWHHLAVRAHAAWNLQGAITDIDDRPWLVIADHFGDGIPGPGYNALLKQDQFATGLPHFSGYHALGIIAGLFDDNASLTEDQNDVTGLFLEQLKVRAVDIQQVYTLSRVRLINNIIRQIDDILFVDSDARIILNTSFAQSRGGFDLLHAYYWNQLVRGSGPNDALEQKVLHFTAAGNADKDSQGNIVRRWNADRTSLFAYAALNDLNPPFAASANRLTNTFVVENRVKTSEINNPNQKQRPLPGCAHDESIMGGNLSAIGTDVWSFGTCLKWDSDLNCTMYGSDDHTSSRTGTGMSTPQAAGVAAFVWSVNPDLSVAEVMDIIRGTAESRPTTTLTSGSNPCNQSMPQSVVDVYAAALAAGGDDARKVLLDVTGTGVFDEADIALFLSEFSSRDGALDYSRFDLNGDGRTGGGSTDRFDLDSDMAYGSVTQDIEGNQISFQESSLTDLDILCYYAYSDLYEGNLAQRTALLDQLCIVWPTDTETEVVEAFNHITGRVWMDRNLGASRAALSSTDADAYGDLYQWGRAADGHQNRNSSTTATLSSSDQPGHDQFITVQDIPFDWRSPQNNSLWQGINGMNNPCPDGYRIPTRAEWEAEIQSWSSADEAGAFASALQLPLAGQRTFTNGMVTRTESKGFYWSSTVAGTESYRFDFDATDAIVYDGVRAPGFSVRCIRYDAEHEPDFFRIGIGISPPGSGTVTGAGVYQDGEVVTITATANPGFAFASWSGDIHYLDNVMSESINSVTMPATDITLTAIFVSTDITNPSTGRTWMDRNLGASRAANSSTDADAYGDLYQWGRVADGHQIRMSTTHNVRSITDQPGHSQFIIAVHAPFDWRSPRNDNLWQGVNGINNPCPAGYRLPTEAEWQAEMDSWSSKSAAGAFASLKLPLSGYRYTSNGALLSVNTEGWYWSSSVDGVSVITLQILTGSANVGGPMHRSQGKSVRCIRD